MTEYFYEAGGPKGHKCGYCGSEDGSVSNGMWTHYLTCKDYQYLIDRGWRRCGKYCYKPVMNVTCSPQYAIRCEATRFRLSKSQKKVLKTMNEYLLNGRLDEAAPHSSKACTGSSETDVSVGTKSPDGVDGSTGKVKSVKPGDGADPSKPPCRKAKEIRRELKLKKQEKRSGSNTGETSQPQSTVGGVGSKKDVPNACHTHAPSKLAAHNSCEETPAFLKVGPDGKKPLETFLDIPTDAKLTHKLELKLLRSHPPSPEFKSTFKESYELYKKYQMTVHKDTEDECNEKQYRRFLCDSPLIPKQGAAGWPCDYGSYHHHYRIDGKLVAVGVVDFLPNCLSSVYTYYDPDFNFLTLGVYTALRELELTRKLYLGDPDHFLYYCMGYYVHECQKMCYKGQYYPSYLLCPESYQFIPIETCRPKLDASRYARLNDETTPPEDVTTWLDRSLVLSERTIMPYAIYKSLVGTKEEAKVTEYAHFVGPSVATRMVLVL